MCKAEIVAKFGSAEVAQQIIDAKITDPEVAKTHVRANKDLHGKDTDDPHSKFRQTILSQFYL